MFIKLSNLRTDVASAGSRDIKAIAGAKLGLHPDEIISCRITASSVDARGKTPVLQRSFILEVRRTPRRGEWRECEPPEKPVLKLPDKPPRLNNVIIAGTGPGGIFAALALTLAGVKVHLFDRGFPVEKRLEDGEKFMQTRQLDENSNLLCGEGGAGTFSDGKLYTGTKSPAHEFVLHSYAEASGVEELTFLQRPHIGSDKLVEAAKYFRKKLKGDGAEFHFGKEIVSLRLENGKCRGVVLDNGEKYSADAVMIFAGLGARKLAKNFIRQGVKHELKTFQLGCRIEHPQSMIDRAMYHLPSRPEVLGAAEYHWVSRPGNAGNCATFCMCPGGEVVMASAWDKQLTTNGMSYFKRDGEFANSALVSAIEPELFSDAFQAWDFIETLERRAFTLGGGDYAAPAQDAAAFIRGEISLKNRRSSFQPGLTPARIDQLLYPAHAGAVAAAVKYFERFAPGFVKYGKLIGQESCVSSPVRFIRDREKLNAEGINNLYLGGEFAGYAGGIVSAAADGIRLAEAMLKNFN